MEKIGYFGGRFCPPHLGHINAIKRASEYCDILYVGVCYSKKDELKSHLNDNCKLMPVKIRFNWLRFIFKDYKNIKIIKIKSKFEKESDWDFNASQVKKIIKQPVNLIFSSEKLYDSNFKRLYPEAEHILIDPERNQYPISASQIRQNPQKYSEYLPEIIKSYLLN